MDKFQKATEKLKRVWRDSFYILLEFQFHLETIAILSPWHSLEEPKQNDRAGFPALKKAKPKMKGVESCVKHFKTLTHCRKTEMRPQ